MKNLFFAKLFVAVLICAMLSACGKKAPPIPPVDQPDRLADPYPPD